MRRRLAQTLTAVAGGLTLTACGHHTVDCLRHAIRARDCFAFNRIEEDGLRNLIRSGRSDASEFV
jgi:hypothetical protein